MSSRGKSVFVCLMVIGAGLFFLARWGAVGQRSSAGAVGSEALHGATALRQLKADGGYASLAEAMAAARYQINTASTQSSQPGHSSQSGRSGAPFYATNPGQQLHATFAPDEVRVNASKTDGAELRLQLTG